MSIAAGHGPARAAALVVYVLGVFALAGATAYPWQLALAALGADDVEFHRLTFRLLKLYALLGLWPLMASLAINDRTHWGYGPDRAGAGGLQGFLAGLAAGVLTMLVVVVPLFALDVRVLKPDAALGAAALGPLVAGAAASALAVGLIEETWFRGALVSAVERIANAAVAVVFVSGVYALVHFIRADIPVPATEVGWASGFEVLGNSFHRFRDQRVADSLFALAAAGVLLALVRLRHGRIAECIGVHAGWVLVIKVARKLSHPNPDADAAFLVGTFDGVIGLGAGVWLTLLCIAYYWHNFSPRSARQPAAH